MKDARENKLVEAVEDAWQDKHCIRMKINRLKLEVVVHPETKRTTTSDLVLLDELSFASLIRCVWDKTLPLNQTHTHAHIRARTRVHSFMPSQSLSVGRSLKLESFGMWHCLLILGARIPEKLKFLRCYSMFWLA